MAIEVAKEWAGPTQGTTNLILNKIDASYTARTHCHSACVTAVAEAPNFYKLTN